MIRNKIDCYLTPRSRKIIKTVLLIFLILAFIPEIYIFPYYFLIVKPSGETEINRILVTLDHMNSTEQKVNAISEWQESNFTNIYGISPNISLDFGLFLFLGTGRYPVYINTSNPHPIKIRAVFSPFTNDPYWITYFHCGACGELAELFNFMANKTHIESRIVRSKGEDHAWVEVKLHEGWYYFDPTLVEIFQKNSEYRDNWFNKPGNFERSWAWNVSRITVQSTEEDRTSEYTPVLTVSMILESTRRLEVFKYDNGKKDWVTIYSKTIPEADNRTHEQVHLGESNRYKIKASNYGGLIPISRYQEQELFQNSSGNVSLTLNPENGQYDYLPGVVIIGLLLVVLCFEIRWILREIALYFKSKEQ